MEVDYAPTEEELAAAAGDEDAKTYGPVEFAEEPTQASLAEDVFAPLIPPLALGVLAFGLVGLVIWAGQRMAATATSHGIGYTRAMDREMATPGPDIIYRPYAGTPARPNPVYANMAAPPPVNRALITGPFLGEAERNAAHAALKPVRDLLGFVRGYDSKGLWDSPALTAAGRAVGVTTAPNASVPAGGIAPAAFPAQAVGSAALTASRAATFQGNGIAQPVGGSVNAVDQIEQIHQRTEAIASEVDRVTPPAQFPTPLQPGVIGVSQELHAYLKDADIASTSDAQSRAQLRAEAARRLQQAQAYIDYMDNLVNGSASSGKLTPPLMTIQVRR